MVRLAELVGRIEVLRRCPEDAATFWLKLKAPVYRLFGYRPKFSVEWISLLVEDVRVKRRRVSQSSLEALVQPEDRVEERFSELFEQALQELEKNVCSAELGARLEGGLAPSYGVWLRNMATVLQRIWPLVDGAKDSWERQIAESVSLYHFAPPLVGVDASPEDAGGIGGGRLVSIDALIAAVRAENQSLERRRRLLEAARETLIEANASLALDQEAVKLRQGLIADQLVEIGRLEAAGISPRVQLNYQLKEAYTRRDWNRLHAGLVGLEQFSLDGAERGMGQTAHQGISAVWKGRDRLDSSLTQESSLRSVDEIFGKATKERLQRGIQKAKEDYRGPNASENAKQLDPQTMDFTRRHVESLDTSVYLNGLLAVDGSFDVGGVLTPTRVVEEKRRKSAVRHPTAELALLPAQGPEDMPDCVIGDPRAIVPDLAAGKLLARRFVNEEVAKNNRTVLLGELRIYLLDGSTSMLTPRSILRDAILIAELCTLIARLSDARRSVNPTLYFQYFEKTVGEVTEITTAEQAADAIAELLATVRTGGTDIQAAMLRSIEQIRAAQAKGMDLARANIILVTDGESPIDELEVVARLDSLGDLQTGISIIALGVENPSLRNLAAHQKAMGRRVFYQYVDDPTIRSIINGQRDRVCLHPPAGVELESCAELLKDTIEQIESIHRASTEGASSDAYLEQALGEMEEDAALREALRGRIEAADRNTEALARRFRYWFPDFGPSRAEVVCYPDQRTESQIVEVVSLLEAVVEVSTLMTADSLALQADALEIFQRGLYDAGISPLEYATLRDRFPERFSEQTQKLCQAVGLEPVPAAATSS